MTIKFFILCSLYYAVACNEFAGPIFASLRPGNTSSFEEMSQRWRAVGNNVSDLTGSEFEPQSSRFKDERITVRSPFHFTAVSLPKQVVQPYFENRIF